MPTIYWTFTKSVMHEGSTEVPDDVIAKGADAVRSYLKKHEEDDAIDYGDSESEFRFQMPANARVQPGEASAATSGSGSLEDK